MERKMKKLRKKYATGICSKYFLETGEPQIVRDKLLQVEDDLKPLLKQQEKIDKKARRKALSNHNKENKKRNRKTKKESEIIFA